MISKLYQHVWRFSRSLDLSTRFFAEKFKNKDTMSLVENRESGEKYLKEHNIDDALRLMRENLIKVQPENPWSFMIDSTFFFVRTTFLRV
tara:strand:- start:223 stop:492 length:270 start_codon:yes stop_codon:yes gene_type:complete